MMKKGSGVSSKGKDPQQIVDALDRLASLEVLVGFPEDTTRRDDSPEDPDAGLTNAALGYIHDNGAPEANIPARPFMNEGIQRAAPRLEKVFKTMGNDVLAAQKGSRADIVGSLAKIDQGYHKAGLIAQASIRAVINEGIDPPLADATLRARAARGRKGAKQELENRSKGEPAGKALAKPLVDTGQLRNAVNYVIRNRKKRSG